jgi:putative membrane protein
MKTIQICLVVFVAFEHLYFMILEMFYWDKPRGLKTFGLKLKEAKISKTLAKNQGLYNGFLAAGLIWSIFTINFEQIALFFLICVTIAGVYGSYTIRDKKLFLIQSIPALIGILFLIIK